MKANSKSTKPTLEQKLQTTPLAVIGMSSIFPQAHNLQEYWDNILNKVDAIVDIPASRWKIDEYYDPNPAAPDKTYCKRGAFVPDIQFDPAEFGLPPNILESTDVTQLLSLVVAKECLEDAGYGEGREFARENVGVILGFVGIGSKLVIPLMARLQYPIWEKVLRSYGISAEDTQKIIGKIKLAYPNWEENTFPGSIGNIVSGRVANRFDLGGTNCVVDAACASSLAAIHMAASELIEGRADMMITGGVDLDNSIGAYLCFSKTPAFSKSQNPSPFDKDSDGMMVGEGIGMVMLKRLADARRDHDRIYAVIKGIGTSSDGRFKSIYAPRPAGQSLAMRRAYAEAGYSPATVGLIEAHGTGTMAGDPAEFQGLNEVFSENNPNKQTIALGSVKSQIAHTKAAAGVASLIKVSLALYHKVLPATIHVNTPNPKLEIEKSPFYLNTEIRPWVRPANYARRAGVSSFGFGGTNFHVALEENESEHTGPYRLNSASKVILLSAPTPDELLTGCQGWSEKLHRPQAKREFVNLALAWTTKAIPHSDARVGFVAANESEAVSQLAAAVDLLKAKAGQESAEHPAGVYFRRSGLDPQGKLVALFPGQGSQYVEMGRELAVAFPPVRQAFADMDAHFDADGLRPLSSVVFPVPAFDSAQKESQSNILTRTEHAQPAIGTLSAGLYKLLQQAGFKADFTAGHSFGELTALWAAGVYNEDAYFTLAKARGKAMAPPADPDFDAGKMLAVKGDVALLQEELKAFPEITLANWNSNNQVVLAGTKPAIAAVQKVLVEKGYSVVALPVSAAFHTALVGHAQKPFAEAIKKVKFNKPGIPVYSNTTGQAHASDPEQIRQSLTEHILNPVRFKDEIEAIYSQGGSIFVEFGPKNVLTNLVKNILEGKPHSAVALNPNAKKDSDRQFREAVAQLCVLGLDLRQYDAYALPPKPFSEAKKSAISVMLNGGLYLTDKTRTAFENAVAQKDTLDLVAARPEPKASSSAVEQPQTPDPADRSAQTVYQAGTGRMADRLQTWREETLKSHNQFLSNDGEYTRLFGQITKQELDLLSGNSSQQTLEQINTALQTLDRSMAQFHQHQAETLRVHEQYLHSQAELINSLMQLQNIPGVLPVIKPTEVQPIASALPEPVGAKFSEDGHSPVESAAVSEPAASAGAVLAISLEILTQSLLEIVSEKTGYPTEMLELGMDMEADLGIDSIKRVEILGAMQVRFPELPKADTAVLSEMRTLGQIVDHMVASAPAAQVSVPVSEPAEKSATAMTVSIPTPAGIAVEIVKQALLEIVSEKTGYPTEMLDPGMDMEADLGIDSIKRVEILGALQTRFPELPKVDTAALAELHTLDQITEYLTSVAPAGEQPAPQAQLAMEEPHNLPRGVVALKFLPTPDHLDMVFPKDRTCILMDGGTDLTPALAKALSGQGIKVVVLGLTDALVSDQRPMPKNIRRVLMEDLTETGIQNTLASLQQEYGPAGMYIHLDPPGASAEAFSENEKTIARTTFLIAKYLMKNLTEAAQLNYAAFVTVTHMDGEFGLTTSGVFGPVSGSLFGLVKTLNLEWDKVFCRAIDLSPDVNLASAVEHIMSELYDPNRLISEVGYSSKGRFTLVVEQPESEN
ncbi:MAG: beta-ketoacyl synthase N-terminal-like domain-containing protein [Anaerolineales bacterium]|nr:beta-ketoacyl synthase N-terminal-like domain-containing protein [Anaerolineales bacterium]